MTTQARYVVRLPSGKLRPATWNEVSRIRWDAMPPGNNHGIGYKMKRAFESGALVRPKCCSRCRAKARIFGHHEDYGKPLEVTWLCGGCHSARHVVLRDAAAVALGFVVVDPYTRAA